MSTSSADGEIGSRILKAEIEYLYTRFEKNQTLMLRLEGTDDLMLAEIEAFVNGKVLGQPDEPLPERSARWPEDALNMAVVPPEERTIPILNPETGEREAPNVQETSSPISKAMGDETAPPKVESPAELQSQAADINDARRETRILREKILFTAELLKYLTPAFADRSEADVLAIYTGKKAITRMGSKDLRGLLERMQNEASEQMGKGGEELLVFVECMEIARQSTSLAEMEARRSEVITPERRMMLSQKRHDLALVLKGVFEKAKSELERLDAMQSA